jgi:amidase
MQRVHAFGDDALGELDAVGLSAAIRAGWVSSTDAIEAAIARAEAVNPALNGLAYNGFEQARAAASAQPVGGLNRFFAGVPTFIKDNVDVAGQPTMRGADAWAPFDAVADSEFTQLYLATGLTSLGKTRMSEFGFSASAEHPRLGPVRNPWDTDFGVGRVRRRRCGTDHPRQRRGWLDPNSGLLQRACRAQAVARPAAAGSRAAPDAGRHRHQRCADPFGAGHRGVLSGGRAHLV